MPRPEVLLVKSPKQWEVFLSPIRCEIAQALRCIGPCSAADLATMVDRPADVLYRHLDQLKKAGFVSEVGTRKRGRHHERLFDVTADDFAIDFAGASSDEEREALISTARSFLGTMIKSFEYAANTGNIVLGQADRGSIVKAERNFVINYELSRLPPEKFRKARALMYELKLLMDEARTEAEGPLYASVTVLCPVTRPQRRKKFRQKAGTQSAK